MFSHKAGAIKPSTTIALNARATEMSAKGEKVVNFTIGEPDFATPDNICAAAEKAMKSGKTRYTPAAGIQELRQAICEKFKRDNGLDYKPSQIVVSCGAKHSLALALQALCNPGDEVIIPVPFWFTYEEQVKLADGKPVFARTSPGNGFRLKAADIEKMITKKTKALIINSPCNPTGAVIEKSELEKIAKLAVKHDFYVVSDEVYEKLIFSGKHVSIAGFGREIYERTITVNAVSKTYAMTGWRVGYTASSEAIAKVMANLQSQTTSGTCSVAQWAAVEALNGPQDSVKKMVAAFAERRDCVVAAAGKIPGIKLAEPDGAFYAFMDVSGLLEKEWNGRKIKTAADFCEALLDAEKVLLVPGEPFHAPGYVRMSYAASKKSIEEGMERLERFAKNLK